MIRWRMLNSNRVEVVPEDRRDAWQRLIVEVLDASPSYSTFRTNINQANFNKFDFKRPLVYDIGEKTLYVNSEFLNKSLNRPRSTITAFNIKSINVLYVFILAILLIVVAAYQFDDRIYRSADVYR
ncbi:pif-6 [Sucra jujuba nucleopolyhedrovirus]|uniref:Pif-6 n=1 Tax=Sucra jujuba nucleopolyhedrovirus TaxID=1563660 RepID=A0A097P922_9ABAC|nr:pif-6 [Sucra jujuba nucleopolyhedrovirus]AIU41299.1 pif-6 [Sucra jujuba nucleopolyhedrovirus]